MQPYQFAKENSPTFWLLTFSTSLMVFLRITAYLWSGNEKLHGVPMRIGVHMRTHQY